MIFFNKSKANKLGEQHRGPTLLTTKDLNANEENNNERK